MAMLTLQGFRQSSCCLPALGADLKPPTTTVNSCTTMPPTSCSAAQIRGLELSKHAEPLLSRMLFKLADLHFSVFYGCALELISKGPCCNLPYRNPKNT
ncbi:hypothetical protein KSP39_PZI014112 [Platanthera zijinensis]|uniref:Uncharacterized protein n=1 Tax=Platanthera zijinensis TaxID=2320716 RepID=A0AAP0G335_9ASPA